MKSAKRLIRGNLGPRGTLDTDAFARALLEHRNTVDPLTGLSPAMVIFGREMKGFLPTQNGKFQPRQEWRLEADLREQAHAKRHAKMEERLSAHSRPLPPLQVGDSVAIQDLSDPCKPGKWTKTGTITESLPYDSYMVRVDGSRRPTQRHRRHLRKITTYTCLLAKDPTFLSRPPPPVMPPTSASPPPAMAPQLPPAVPAPALPASPPPPAPGPPPALVQPQPTPQCTPTASTHRHQPLAPPGTDVVTKLSQIEREGSHLAIQPDTDTGAANSSCLLLQQLVLAVGGGVRQV